MDSYNLYWPVYQNLENEFLNITHFIHFDDNQLNTYSEKFVDLLLRIWVEIESISKQLYIDNGGQVITPESEMYFDTICIDYLEQIWKLSSKLVYISNASMYFSSDNSILYPLKKANKRGTSGSKWKRAYQAIKHNRFNNFKQGNLSNCINSLAALYILNIYYKNKEYKLGDEKGVNSFDLSQGSKIFSIKTCKCNSFDGKIKDDDESIYIINYTDSFIAKWNENNILLNKTLIEEIVKDSKFIDELNNKNVSLKDLSDVTKIQNIIGSDKYVEHLKVALQKSNINNLISNQQFRAYLNKSNN